MMTRADETLPGFTPLVVHERGEIVSALVERRHALNLRGEDLDEMAGWADRYTGKLEKPNRPSGRPSFHFDFPSEVTPAGAIRATAMGAVWLEALGLRLVLVDAATARAIGAVPAPAPIPATSYTPADGRASGGHRQQRLARGRRSTMTIQAYEAADRTQVASLAFKVAVTDHPFLVARPELRAPAERIEADLAALADLIREAA
jgi:hypothetical protein